MLRFIAIKTSVDSKTIKFQYIPCYGLSYLKIGVCTKIVLFQYIPCYGLSKRLFPFCIPWDNFNTSHVTVYQDVAQWGTQGGPNFNTSHVTVYRLRQRLNIGLIDISIHPMLRFILRLPWSVLSDNSISIHPMLRFIRIPIGKADTKNHISIHPMLRFIV